MARVAVQDVRYARHGQRPHLARVRVRVRVRVRDRVRVRVRVSPLHSSRAAAAPRYRRSPPDRAAPC